MAAVEVTGLTKVFRGRKEEVRALDGLHLAIEEGTVLALLGPNGSGKTTTVRILATLLDADDGTATVLGHDVAREPDAVRSMIGLSGQFSAVDENLTGRENLWMFARLYGLSSAQSRNRAEELLDNFDLSDAADRVTKHYSGGMKRRLDLAGSLVAHPQVLFLDEPTTGLDPRSRIDLWEVIRSRVRAGVTLLLTTQYLEEADALADCITVIDRGRVIAEGTADSLKASVGGERVELVVRDASQLGTAQGILSRVAGDDVGVDDRNRKLTVASTGGAASLVQVIRDLDAAGIDIDDIALRRPTLDDVFLTLTGRGCEDTAPAGAVQGAAR